MTVRSLAAAARELEALIGAEGPEIRAVVDRRDIERFVVATGNPSAIYVDDAAARAAGYERVPAPAMFVTSMIEWGAGPALASLRPDGTGVGRESWLPLRHLRLMGGGQDVTFHEPVLSDTEITARPSLAAVTLKEGGSGSLILLVIVTVFRAVGGGDLLTCHETIIAR